MLPLIADEDFDGRIVRGLRQRITNLDLVRVQDIGLAGAHDAEVLQWAETQRRVLLTRDARTMPRYVSERLGRGEHVPGVFVLNDRAPIGVSIDHLVMVIECSEPSEWTDQVIYLPWK